MRTGQTHRIPLGAFLAVTMLAACFICERAHAGSTTPVKQAAARPSPSAASPATEPAAIIPRGRAYLFRGALGPIFSRGMDKLAEQIAQAGVSADVYEFTICSLIASRAIEDYRRDPEPIILIGHSMGGRCGLLFSETLQEQNIPVSLLVTIDPAHMSPKVPLNVERFINIFLSKDVLGGGDILPTQGFQGHYASYDFAQRDEVSHITIDKMETIHQQLIAKILQLAATPAKAEGEVAPLRYVQPPNTEIDLWDSGMMVTARPRDTLQTIALQYHVPLWSLTQVNRTPENAPLVPGQRVILPRHLTPPPVAVSEALPPR